MIYLITQTDGKSFQLILSDLPTTPCRLHVEWSIKGTDAHGREALTITKTDSPWRRIETIPNEQGELEVTVKLNEGINTLHPILKAWGPETRPFQVQVLASFRLLPGTSIVIPDGGIWTSTNRDLVILKEGESTTVNFVCEAPLCRMQNQALRLDQANAIFTNDGTNKQAFKEWTDARQSIVPPSQGFMILP